MPINQDKFYFLNWELIPSLDDLLDATEGNEVLEITIQEIDRCRPPIRYTLPIVQQGQSFALIRANLIVRIVRGYERRVIYTNDYILAAPNYANGGIFRIPIHRVWYWDDYVRSVLARLLP